MIPSEKQRCSDLRDCDNFFDDLMEAVQREVARRAAKLHLRPRLLPSRVTMQCVHLHSGGRAVAGLAFRASGADHRLREQTLVESTLPKPGSFWSIAYAEARARRVTLSPSR
jgi:hypothetical protein